MTKVRIYIISIYTHAHMSGLRMRDITRRCGFVSWQWSDLARDGFRPPQVLNRTERRTKVLYLFQSRRRTETA